MNFANSVTLVVDVVEQLLMELACDQQVSPNDLKERTHEIIAVLHNMQARDDLIQRIEQCQNFYEENPNYEVILQQIQADRAHWH